MGVKRALQLESETITDMPISIPFEFRNKESLPEGKEVGDCIVITPITVRTWFKLKPLILSIDAGDLEELVLKRGDDEPFGGKTAELMSKYDDLIFDIVCIGLYNKRGGMPTWFRDVLKDNCTWEDIYILLNAIIYRIGNNSFTNTITVLRAVSPLTEEEIIALQKNRKSWTMIRKAATCS